MSNRICIQRCEFANYPNHDLTYGFRAYDDYGQTYGNTCSIEQMTAEPLEFLKWLAENVEDACLLEMIDFAKDARTGLYIDDTWHDWDEIRQVLESDSVDPQNTLAAANGRSNPKEPSQP